MLLSMPGSREWGRSGGLMNPPSHETASLVTVVAVRSSTHILTVDAGTEEVPGVTQTLL